MIDKKTVDLILDTARIEEVVEDFVNLKRRGVNMLGLCPFHDEKTPSFTVSPTKNIYKCFGCGKGGFPVNFIMEHENMGFPEALKYLARKYNITIEEKEATPEELASRQLADSLYIVNEYAQEYFDNQLFNTNEGKSVGMSYFKQRGYREAIIKKFQLGYTNAERDDFSKNAVLKKYNIEHLRALGLTTRNDIDFFRSRVMFAIHNLSGKVIAFAGRTLSSDKKVPKYMNSPESEIYNKSKTLYGLYFAKGPIRKNDECIMVEGYTDVITLHQYGIENVVASSGTSLTSGQVNLVKRYTSNMKIIYDGDAAGIKAALRGVDIVLEQDMNVKIVVLPEGEDPDSFMKSKGTEAFQQYLIDEEKDFLFFKSQLLLNEVGNDPIKKSMAMKDIVSSIAKIPDQLKRTLYIQESSRMFDVSEQIIVAETEKFIKKDHKRKQVEKRRNKQEAPIEEEQFVTLEKQAKGHQTKPVLNDDAQEKDIVRILVNLGDKIYDTEHNITVAQYILSNIKDDLDKIDNATYKEMLLHAKAAVERGEAVNSALFAKMNNTEIQTIVVDLIANPYTYADWEKNGVFLQTQKVPEENFVRDSYQAILRFKLTKIKKFVKIVEQRIKESQQSGDAEAHILNIKVLQKLLEERNSIAKELNSVVL